MAEAGKRTKSRREMARHERFEQVSPEVGELDEAAVEEGMREDPDDTLALLADLTGATDPVLRDLARRLAGRLFLDVSRRGPVRPRGIGRLDSLPYRPDGGDLDIDASIEALAEAGASGGIVDVERLRTRSWVKPGTAIALLVDRSGSMGGKPLATAACAAAAVAWRAPADYSVLAFSNEVIVAKSQDVPKASDAVVTAVLTLRGYGTTDLAGALQAAAGQLSRSRAGRRVTVLLSDCRANCPGDVVAAARGLDELVVIAPADDHDEADAFAARVGARVALIDGPSDLPSALAQVLGD